MATTMFGKPRYSYLSEIVVFSPPSKVVEAVRILKREFRTAKTLAKKLRVARATRLASNRARASSRRESLTRREASRLRAVSAVYGRASVDMFDAYGELAIRMMR